MIPTLSLLLLLSSGAQATTWSEGRQMVKDGRFYEAIRFWLDALDDDEFDQGALRGLDRWAEDAYEQRLDVAQEHEAERRFQESLDAYEMLLELNTELLSIEAIEYSDHEHVIQIEMKDTRAGWVQWLLQEGARGIARKDWEHAEKHYEGALVLEPKLPEAKKQLSRAQYELGLDYIEGLKYRSAANYFDKAVANGFGSEAQAWSFATHKELGKYFMNEGACRQGARDLRMAGDLSDDFDMVALLTRAEDCARVELIVEPFESVAGENMVGSAPAAMLVDRLESALRDQGSEFLVLLDPKSQTAADALAGGLAGARPGALYQIRGRITQLAVERQEPTSTDRSVESTYQIICPLPEGVYYRPDEWCDETATVFFTEDSARVHALAEGTVKVIEPRSSEQLITTPISAKVDRQAVQNTGFSIMVEGEKKKVQVGEAPSKDVYAVPADVLEMLEQPPPLPTDSAIASEVTTELARNMATAILEVIDNPEPLEEPRVIDDFMEPVLNAHEIDLSGGTGSGAVEEPPPPEPEPDKKPTKAVIPK